MTTTVDAGGRPEEIADGFLSGTDDNFPVTLIVASLLFVAIGVAAGIWGFNRLWDEDDSGDRHQGT